MTGKRPQQGNAPLRELASIADIPLHRVYARFREPGAPAPAEHVACVPAYDVELALAFLGAGGTSTTAPSAV